MSRLIAASTSQYGLGNSNLYLGLQLWHQMWKETNTTYSKPVSSMTVLTDWSLKWQHRGLSDTPPREDFVSER